MKDYYCEYQKQGTIADKSDMVKIMQVFDQGGTVKIGKASYPITFGGLYFVGHRQKYSILPENEQACKQNCVMVSASLLEKIGKELEFETELDEIFQKDVGYYLPLEHYKIVDARMKEIQSIYYADEHYGKALLMAKVLDILNYPVSVQWKAKKQLLAQQQSPLE